MVHFIRSPFAFSFACFSGALVAGCGQAPTWNLSLDSRAAGPGANAAGADAASAPPSDQVLVTNDASPTTAAPGATTLTVTIRDFKFYNPNDPQTNPDFQNVVADDHGAVTSGPNVVGTIVGETLGADGKPVYKNTNGKTVTTHGKADFDQWYNDVSGVNIHVVVPISLTMSAQGTWGYDSRVSGVPLSPPGNNTRMWFPIDDGTMYATAFGDQGEPHNYSFTTELHTTFRYNGGETFTFSGDDDVFVFINGRLVIDLGGVHQRESASVALDSLGLVQGQTYPLDLFNAERHTTESNVSFTTTLALQPVPQ